MNIQRRSDLKATPAGKREPIDKYSARRFPIESEIQRLQKELNDFNERILELESEGHRGHAMEVLKAHAIKFARQIDELRCVLVESARGNVSGEQIKCKRRRITS